MRVLVIGSKGMLGKDLMEELANPGYEVIGLGLRDLDISKEFDMPKIEAINPDLIINCAAYTNVDKAESERDRCYSTNVTGVKNIVNFCKKNDIIMIQYSTDYVFSGDKEGYNEEDRKQPINYYGETKSQGEDYIINNLNKCYIIRTSWLYGKNGKNFVDTIINLCKDTDEIKVVNDQTGRPTYTKDLSKATIYLIKNKNEYGIYHITNSDKCSWFEFAQEIVKLKGLNSIINPCTSEEFPRDAKRPKFSVLNNNKIESLRSWKEALRDYLGQ